MTATHVNTNPRRNIHTTRFVFEKRTFNGDADWRIMADTRAQETVPPPPPQAKESPFSIKNLLNMDTKPAKPRTFPPPSRGALFEGSIFSRIGDLTFPRFEFPSQRVGLAASAWWNPYALGAMGHLRTSGILRSMGSLYIGLGFSRCLYIFIGGFSRRCLYL